jgi:putative ABC transport system substrate-binding protein
MATIHRELIIALAVRHRLPAVYYSRYYATGGGLISYGPDASTHAGPLATRTLFANTRENWSRSGRTLS